MSAEQVGQEPQALRVWHRALRNADFALRTSLCVLFIATNLLAYPPAPHHLVFGLVRDELGNPLNSPSAEVLLEAGGTALARTTLIPAMEPGANYRLTVPLDSGVTPDLYQPTALRPTVPFRMHVRIAGVTYLPLEMTGAASLWTRPAAVSRVDLTLGVDSDGDGLPDAWERALAQMLGGELTLADIRPQDDGDGDGISNLEEYLAGTYAFDPTDGFVLEIAAMTDGGPVLEFMAIRGRSYRLHGSEDLITWTPISFGLAGEESGAPLRLSYRADDTRLIRAHVASPPTGLSAWRFFKLEVR